METMKLPAPCIELDNFNSDYWSLNHSRCSELPMCLMSLNESSGIRSSRLWSLPLHNLASLFKMSIHGPAESSLHFSYQSRVWLMSYLIFSEKELFIFSSRAMLVCSAIQILWTSCCYTFLTVNLSCQKYMLNLVQGKSLYEGACMVSKGNKPSIAHNVFMMKANHYLHINSVYRFMFLGSWSYNDSKYTITYMYVMHPHSCEMYSNLSWYILTANEKPAVNLQGCIIHLDPPGVSLLNYSWKGYP